MKTVMYALAGAAALVALAAGPAAGQARTRPGGGGGGAPAGGHAGGGGAVVRGGGSWGGSAPVVRSGPAYRPVTPYGSSPRGTAWRGAPTGRTATGGGIGGRRIYGAPYDYAVPSGARPNPGTAVIGQAVVRPNTPPPPYYPGHDINWGYNPWLFAGFGFYSSLYYDPFWWGYWTYPYGYVWDPLWAEPAYYGEEGYYGQEPVGQGGLKLKVEPKSAEVYVDGNLAGTVDDFDGVFQRLELEAGPHHVEIRAPGYRTVGFDVRIDPDQTVTYRGELQLLSTR